MRGSYSVQFWKTLKRLDVEDPERAAAIRAGLREANINAPTVEITYPERMDPRWLRAMQGNPSHDDYG